VGQRGAWDICKEISSAATSAEIEQEFPTEPGAACAHPGARRAFMLVVTQMSGFTCVEAGNPYLKCIPAFSPESAERQPTMSGTNDDADSIPSDVEPADADDATHTESGAPTDKAHEEVGDGSSTGSVPAGLTVSEMEEFMKKPSNEGGTG
jgi:hypothetical protein